MPKPRAIFLRRSNWPCLKALWSLQEGNVKDVQRLVAQSRPLAYTTIMTVLERLVRKGKLARRKVGRAFVYSPEASRDAMRRTAIQELLEGFFDGSGSRAAALPPRRRAPACSRSAPVEEQGRIDTVLL